MTETVDLLLVNGTVVTMDREYTVFPQGAVLFEGEPDSRPKPLFQNFPNGVNVQFEVEEPREQSWNEASVPWARGIRSMHWDALDPNGDGLVFDIYYRALDEKRWKLLKKDHEMTYFAWESEGLADGEYEARVVASDRPGGKLLVAVGHGDKQRAFVVEIHVNAEEAEI